MLFKAVSSVCIYRCFFVTSHYHTVFLFPLPPTVYSSFLIIILSCTYHLKQRKEIPKGLFLSLPAALCSALKLGDATVFFIAPPSNTHTHKLKYFDLVPTLLLCTQPVRNPLSLLLMGRRNVYALMCSKVECFLRNYKHPVGHTLLFKTL